MGKEVFLHISGVVIQHLGDECDYAGVGKGFQGIERCLDVIELFMFLLLLLLFYDRHGVHRRSRLKDHVLENYGIGSEKAVGYVQLYAGFLCCPEALISVRGVYYGVRRGGRSCYRDGPYGLCAPRKPGGYGGGEGHGEPYVFQQPFHLFSSNNARAFSRVSGLPTSTICSPSGANP